MEGLRWFLAVLLPLFAGFAALAGVVALEAFFRNRLKELFNDTNYFIFFFLVWGYILYALGEVSFYLTTTLFPGKKGIEDFYWSAGALLIVVSFAVLTFTLFRQYPDNRKFTTLALAGGVMFLTVLFVLFGITFRTAEGYFFGYFYPIISSFIVTFALSAILFSPQLRDFGSALFVFFLASCAILLGDLFFTFATAQGTQAAGLAGLFGDLFYAIGYAVSGIAFVVLRLRLHELAFGRSGSLQK